MQHAPKPAHLLDALSEKDRQLLVDGLAALLRERSMAFEIASHAATSSGGLELDVHDFGLPDILRLSRNLQCVSLLSVRGCLVRGSSRSI